MNGIPSSTFFSAPPDWGWLIVLYFFFGGLAGGCYFLAALIDLVGRPEDRPLARLGYYIAFPCVILSGLLLTVDLGWRVGAFDIRNPQLIIFSGRARRRQSVGMASGA